MINWGFFFLKKENDIISFFGFGRSKVKFNVAVPPLTVTFLERFFY
ncbi:MAG: hypothetical protein Ct9H300mP18_09710 [Candidatus Neomarinimicrobiota bacterium]|nr:MAG: hypothetical protein Ct9H300mP18_09710 [Candidatus Neomarinimicrobiota bacterium]